MIAGEASGDLHGSNLIRALVRLHPQAQFRIWGGDRMAEAGGELVKHYRDLAFMGFVEVARNLRTILRNLDFCKQDILAFNPDAIVLIDYPGFNLRIAKWARTKGIKVIYYISPQIWAWHSSRVKAIQRDVDKMLVILPFEQQFFKKHGVEVDFVGHPLLDALASSEEEFHSQQSSKPIIALLPGSRKQEVRRILPQMLSTTSDFPGYQFIIAGSTSLPESVYSVLLSDFPEVQLIFGKTYSLLRSAQAALVKSGTSTLETALLNVPQVVCYAGNPVSYQIAKRLVEVPYISLVNLILDRPLVKELIQHDLNRLQIRKALSEVLDPIHAARIREGYAELRRTLGEGGASERAAEIIIRTLTQ